MIKNTTRNKVLMVKQRTCDTLLSKATGLMFKSKINYGLVFNFNIENNHSFHTMFMRLPIDMLFLDSSKKVTKVFKNVKPWKLSIVANGKYVIELPYGKSFNTRVGDKISFK